MTIANQAEYDAWNGDAGLHWVRDADHRDRMTEHVGAALLEAADLRSGEVVLDIGCGCGAVTIAAARSAGQAGAVVGVDLSGPMLDIARRRVAAAGITNVRLSQADAQTARYVPGSFDIAVSRFGTIVFDDPVAAFVNITAGLAPGGRVCIVTWQPLVANDWLTIPGAALLRFGRLPAAAGGPGMFAQSSSDVIADVLARSGLSDVAIRATTIPLVLGAEPDEATAYLAESGVGRAVLATISDTDHQAALGAVRAVLAEHIGPRGVELDGAILISTATKP